MDESVKDRIGLAARLAVLSCYKQSEEALLSVWQTRTWESNISGSMLEVFVVNREDIEVRVVAVRFVPTHRCLVTLLLKRPGDSDPVGQVIGQGWIDLADDLNMKTDDFPINFKTYITKNTDMLQKIRRKLQNNQEIHVANEPPLKVEEKRTTTLLEPESSLGGKDSEIPIVSRRIPPDMPQFEDEYEVQKARRQPLDQYPGLNMGPRNPGGYGNTDLYPTGERAPNLLDPLGTSRPPNGQLGHGGMTFDPLADIQRQHDERNQRNNPGRMPGARWDDPFGGSNSDGFNFPGSGGFGPGSFI